jgi:hypothetical protein
VSRRQKNAASCRPDGLADSFGFAGGVMIVGRAVHSGLARIRLKAPLRVRQNYAIALLGQCLLFGSQLSFTSRATFSARRTCAFMFARSFLRRQRVWSATSNSPALKRVYGGIDLPNGRLLHGQKISSFLSLHSASTPEVPRRVPHHKPLETVSISLVSLS